MAKKRGPREGSASQAIRVYIGENPTVGPTAIQEAMAAQGLTVSKSLINNLKYGKNKVVGKARRGRPPKAATAAARSARGDSSSTAVAEAPTGARGEKANAIVAAFHSLGRKTKASVIVRTLREQGIVVSPAHVAKIKFRINARRKARREATAVGGMAVGGMAATGMVRPLGRPRREVSDEVSVNDLLEAKTLVDRLGGVDRASKLLSVLSKLL